MFYLTPPSVTYFSQTILAILIAAYLAWRSRQPGVVRPQLLLAAAMFTALTLVLAAKWVEVSATAPWRNYANFLNGPLTALNGVALFQFLYRVPEWQPAKRREALIALVLTVAALVMEVWLAVSRLNHYAVTGEAIRTRALFTNIPVVLTIPWLAALSFVRTRRLAARSPAFRVEVILVLALVSLLVLIQVARSAGWLTVAQTQISVSICTMLALPLLVLIVLDMLSDPLSLQVRLVGVALAMVLFLVSSISWLLAPSYLNLAAGRPPLLLPERANWPALAQTLSEASAVIPNGQSEELLPGATGAAAAAALAERRALHEPMLLITLAALLAAVLVVGGLPLLLQAGLFRPLGTLLRGVRQVNAGRLDLALPVQAMDEIGEVTEAFNHMVAELRDTVNRLEERVAQRTADLTRSEMRYRGLVEQIDEVIVRVTLPELRVEYVSPSVERLLGYRIEDVNAPGFLSSGMLQAGFGDWLDAHAVETGLTRDEPHREYRIVDGRGRQRWIQQSNTGLYEEGRLIGVEGVCRDVTANKLAEAQLRSQESELAALEERERIGRDLHDGLGQVMGYVNVQAQAAATLIAGGQTAQAEALLGQLAQIAQDAQADIRRFILSLRHPVAAEVVEWETALRGYLRAFSQSYGVEVQLSYPATLPPDPFLPAVGREVLQIIQEALNNVRKHAGVKSAQVVILQPRGEVTIVVADVGRGFAADAAGSAESIEAPEGQFGLRIMRERAETIGATLDVCSAPGAGTQVTLHVPLTVDNADGVTPAGALPDASVQGLRVLLADDHPLFREGIHNMLTARGVRVVGVARDGVEAQELARALRPDVILMDMNMPRADGLAATGAIKAELPDTKIIILTVSADQEKLFAALSAGASGYLLKSLNSAEFFQLLAEALRGEIVLSQGLAEQALTALARRTPQPAKSAPRDPLAILSPRQRDILERAARGSTYKEIATALFLSEATVKYHMGQIIELLQVESRREAIALARQAGLG